MNRLKKKVMILFTLFMIVFTVGAVINTYFGQIETTLDVKQPVIIDDNLANQTIVHSFKVWAGDSETVKHVVKNQGSLDVNISQITYGLTTGLELDISWTNGTEVQFPFILDSETKVTLVFTYSTDINLKEKVYTIKTRFSCEVNK